MLFWTQKRPGRAPKVEFGTGRATSESEISHMKILPVVVVIMLIILCVLLYGASYHL